MATFEITAPDGSKYRVDAPKGATQEDALKYVQANHDKLKALPLEGTQGAPALDTRTQRVKDFMQSTLSRAEEFSPLAPVARGLLKAGAGIGQLGADVADTVVGSHLGDKVTQFVNAIMPEDKTPREKAGSFIGEAAPFAIAAPETVAGMMAAGGLTGASQYQPTGSSGADRLVQRGIGGAVGAGTAGVLGAVGEGITKIVNSKQIENLVERAKSLYTENDPAIAAQRGTLNQLVDRLKTRYQGMGQQVVQAGEKLGPLNLSDVAPKLRDISDSTGKMLAPDKKGVSILKEAVKQLAPDTEFPPSIKVMGEEYFRQPTNQYVSKQGAALPASIMKAALDARDVNPAPKVGFAQMQQSMEEMNSYIKGAKDPKNPAVQAVTQARDLLKQKLDSVKTPSMKAMETRTQNFYQKNIAKYDDPVVKDILEEQDPLNRANKAIKVALGDDGKVAQTVADLVGPKGKDAVRQAVVARGLGAATGKDGRIDAAKFVNFFEGKPGFKPFQDAESELTIKGIAGFLKEDALKSGQSVAPSIGHPSGGWGWVLAADRLMHGDLKGSAMAASSAAIVRPTVELFNRMMNDSFGRNLLAASAKAVPGTPRAGRILEQALQRFGPAAVGTAAGQAVGQP